jgi:hypothetical protein
MLKTKNLPMEPNLIFLIFVSLFGLVLSFVFVTISGGTPDGFDLRRPLVGSVFGTLCVLGAFAAIYPNACSKVFDYEKNLKPKDESEEKQGPNIRGHHPTCRNYSAHILIVNSRILCSTCTGFSVGAIIALVGVGLFFFGPFSFGTRPFIAMIIGASAVSIGLLHSILPGFKVGFSRFIASAFFAVGAFLILASIEDALSNTSIDFFIVLLSVLWLITDTALSRWDHRRICSNCALQTCSANSN